jgi:nicotinamidase-related amidase
VSGRQAFQLLEAAGQIAEEEAYVAQRGKGYQSRWLRWSAEASPDEVQAVMLQAETEAGVWGAAAAVEDVEAEQPTAAAPTPPAGPTTTPAGKLAALQQHARELLALPFPERMPLLRVRAQDLDITLRDSELQQMIWRARREARGSIEPIKPGDRIDFTPDPWLWQGFIMAKALNLLVALPKIGKTSLMLAMIGAWRQSQGSFLGAQLIGGCPPVLVVGTDQPVSDWGRMLQQVGLLEGETLASPIVGLFHRGAPLHLDAEGIERVAAFAQDHPGLLILLDSVAACTGPLGLDENSAEIVEPINDLMEAVTPHGATVVAIHHASKGRAGQGATMASRGSTALPAAASQVLELSRVQTNPGAAPDRRLVLRTEGRGGLPEQILIERGDDGWICHGSADEVQLAQHLLTLEEKLTDRQAEALEAIRSRWEGDGLRTDAKALGAAVGAIGGDERQLRRTMEQLQRKGLLQAVTEVSLQGRVRWFWPVGGGDRTPSRGGVSDAPYVSEVSEPLSRVDPGLRHKPNQANGSDTSDTSDTPDSSPREGVRRVSYPPGQAITVDGEPGWALLAEVPDGGLSGDVLVISPDGLEGPVPCSSVAFTTD